MATITAAMVKDLRESTGAGMMDCKAALTETAGDMQAAQDWLRKKGLSKAAKKAGRVAAEGLIGSVTKGTRGVVVEVNSETDFVARNEQFQGLVKMIAQVALDVGGDVEKVKAAKVGSVTVETAINDAIATIGENMTLRRAAQLEVSSGVVSNYVHNAVIEGAGKMGVIVALESTGKADELATLGRQLAMHVAAANPQAIDPSGLDPVVVKREKDVLADKYRQQGKPENVIEKIVESGLKNYYKEVCLLEQAFIHDSGGKSVAQVLKKSRASSARRSRSRLRALCSRRGHREAGIRFRSRSRGGQRQEVTVEVRSPAPLRRRLFARDFGE
jgi:elongation factor Ts